MSSAVQYIHNINTLNASSKQQKKNEKKTHFAIFENLLH